MKLPRGGLVSMFMLGLGKGRHGSAKTNTVLQTKSWVGSCEHLLGAACRRTYRENQPFGLHGGYGSPCPGSWSPPASQTHSPGESPGQGAGRGRQPTRPTFYRIRKAELNALTMTFLPDNCNCAWGAVTHITPN